MIGRSSIRISIVIPVYNQTSLLPVLLNSIDEPDLDGQIEVIIVDDRSNEDVEKAISRCKKPNPVSIISREINGGYAAAVNTGISVANGDAVLLLNSDVFLTRSYIALLLNTIKEYRNTAVVTGVCLFPQSGNIQNAGIAFSKTNHYLLYYNSNPERAPIDEITMLQAAAFASVMIPMNIFDEIGVLDEELVNGYDDIDFCFRARSRGFEIRLEPKAFCYHWERLSRDPRGVRRRDNIARVWSRWGAELKPDIIQYLALSARRLQSQFPDVKSERYLVLLLGQDAGITLLRDSIVAGDLPFKIDRVQDARQYSTVSDRFLLPLAVADDVTFSERPLLILVDRIDQIDDNIIWIKNRKAITAIDIAIDLHGNVVLVGGI